MKQICLFVCLCAGVSILSGCNQNNPLTGEPVPQKVVEAPEIGGATAPISRSDVAGGKKVKDLAAPVGFDMKAFKAARVLELPSYNDSISSFAFSPDSTTIAGAGRGRIVSKVEGGERGVVFLFDVKSGALLKRLASEALPNAQGLGPNVDRAVWSPDGKLVAAWNVDSSGPGSALYIWDVKSGQRTAVFRNSKFSVSNMAWTGDSSLLIARSDQAKGLTIHSQLLDCNGVTGKINHVYDMGNRSVTSVHALSDGATRLLVLEAVGPPKTTREPDVQSSIRAFDKGILGPALVQFKTGEAFLAASFTSDDRVALSGIEQGETDSTAALYAVGNLETGQIVWQIKKPVMEFSLNIALSSDEKQFWARTPVLRRDDLLFDLANGKSLSAPTKLFPFFAPNGKRFVRLLDSGKRSPSGQLLPDGTKPHLRIAEIWER